MKLQGEKMVNLNLVLHVTQAVKNMLIVSNMLSKGATMGDNKDKITIKKNGVNMTIDARNRINDSMIFYLKAKRYFH